MKAARKLRDPLQRFFRQWRLVPLLHVEELSPHMHPAGCLRDSACLLEFVESRETIGPQNAPVVLKMFHRMLALAIQRVDKTRLLKVLRFPPAGHRERKSTAAPSSFYPFPVPAPEQAHCRHEVFRKRLVNRSS